MNTWRERIADAESRRIMFGLLRWPRFTEGDRLAWAKAQTCVVGEVAKRYAQSPSDFHRVYVRLNEATDASFRSLGALLRNSPRKLTAILNEVEDVALQMKREGTI